MKIIKKGTSSVEGIIGKNSFPQDASYRLSNFCFLHSKDDIYLAKLTLTSEVISLTKEEYSFLSEMKSVRLEDIEKAGLTELVKKRYIVEESYDEFVRYQDVLSITKVMQKKPRKGYAKYTILPTTGCNARCFYCFEQGMVAQTMSDETADRLVDYICETNAYNGTDKEIHIDWFGGEPTASRSIVTRICKGLSGRGVKFRSGIVTNGSLITPEYVEEMKSVWNLKKVQLSIDGSRDDYNVRKAYVNPALHNYDTVLKAIGYLADADIRVVLRCNVDIENVDRIDDLILDLKRELTDKGRKTVRLYFAPLHQSMAGDGIEVLMRKINKAYDRMEELGAGELISFPISNTFKVNYCMADTMDTNVIIMPDGSFNNCENLPDNHCWGNIFDGVTDPELYDRLKRPTETDEECRHCTFLPECTSYRKTSCPVTMSHCARYEAIRNEYAMIRNYNSSDAEEGEDPC